MPFIRTAAACAAACTLTLAACSDGAREPADPIERLEARIAEAEGQWISIITRGNGNPGTIALRPEVDASHDTLIVTRIEHDDNLEDEVVRAMQDEPLHELVRTIVFAHSPFGGTRIASFALSVSNERPRVAPPIPRNPNGYMITLNSDGSLSGEPKPTNESPFADPTEMARAFDNRIAFPFTPINPGTTWRVVETIERDASELRSTTDWTLVASDETSATVTVDRITTGNGDASPFGADVTQTDLITGEVTYSLVTGEIIEGTLDRSIIIDRPGVESTPATTHTARYVSTYEPFEPTP